MPPYVIRHQALVRLALMSSLLVNLTSILDNLYGVFYTTGSRVG
jgi:hypothetical protein